MNLVTGGAGFLGSHVVSQLLTRGEPVRVLELPHVEVNHLPSSVEIVRGDIRDRATVRAAVKGCRQVYHLAANPNLWARDPRDFDAVNHQGTIHVLREALGSGVARILHCSTESILTSPRREGGAVETLQLHREDMLGPYCLSKYEAECVALQLATRGEPVIVVNPTLPIGPGDRGLSPPTRMMLAVCRGQLPAYLDCRLNLIDARDVASGMVLAMERGLPGRRYLLGSENLHLHQWMALVAQHAGTKPPRIAVPYWLALGVAHLSEFWANHVSGRMPNATVTGVKLTRRSMHFDPAASLQELGLQPRPIGESIADAVAWFREMGWLAKSR